MDNDHCRNCGVVGELAERDKTFNGITHRELFCTACGAHQRFLRQDKPAAEHVMPFGKYKGKTLGWIKKNDLGYFQWAAEQLKGGMGLRFKELLR